MILASVPTCQWITRMHTCATMGLRLVLPNRHTLVITDKENPAYPERCYPSDEGGPIMKVQRTAQAR